MELVWCETCSTTHVQTMPVVTFRCADCPWAEWYQSQATRHAIQQPTHVPYVVFHRITQDWFTPATTGVD